MEWFLHIMLGLITWPGKEALYSPQTSAVDQTNFVPSRLPCHSGTTMVPRKPTANFFSALLHTTFCATRPAEQQTEGDGDYSFGRSMSVAGLEGTNLCLILVN